MLILFDIDATLITTDGSGVRALHRAGLRLHGPAFTSEGMDYAGRLDPLIIADLLRLNGLEPSVSNIAAFRQAYGRELPDELRRSTVRSLPGVLPLLDELALRQHATLGVLTGNFRETGTLKLEACGVATSRFRIFAWGDEAPNHPPSREQLPEVAIRRYREHHGRSIEPERVVVIGDTPHDVSCARAHRCRSLAVATGRYSAAELAHAGADRVVPDLSATADVLAWLLAEAPVAGRAPGGPAT